MADNDSWIGPADRVALLRHGIVVLAGVWYEGPWHVYLERPLEGRAVIDGVSGSAVPYKNVFAKYGA